MLVKNIVKLDVAKLHKLLGFDKAIDCPESLLTKPWDKWKMEEDDAPIFRYLYRNLKPKRHLEFGTWHGAGTFYCLEECDATVWTINLPFGEKDKQGKGSYGFSSAEMESMKVWAKKVGLHQDNIKSDSLGFIGRFYLEKGFGNRVCQIYCDSRAWDTSNYPPGFFDTALIDGGHQREVVVNDTQKAMELLRPGGVILWHDYCLEVYDNFFSVKGVVDAIAELYEWLVKEVDRLYWIYPSWILLGVKKGSEQYTDIMPDCDKTENKQSALSMASETDLEEDEIKERLGQMLKRGRPVSADEFEDASRALKALLGALDIATYIERNYNKFPPAMLLLLNIRLEWAKSKGIFAGIERMVYALELIEDKQKKERKTIRHTNENFLAYAYWNQREALTKCCESILALSEVVGNPNDFSLYQWAQLMAFVLQFKPDLILELGRWSGRSTCAFVEAANLLKPNPCRVLSICLSNEWEKRTSNQVSQLVQQNWRDRLEINQGDICQLDYKDTIASAFRVMVYWNTPGYQEAECILGNLLPLIADLEHVVIMHGISDARYVPSSDYGANSLWKWDKSEGKRLRLGNIFTARKDAIAVVDFISRNELTLFSADHSLHSAFDNDPLRVDELKRLLREMFSIQAHWFWFTLNEGIAPFTFPKFYFKR